MTIKKTMPFGSWRVEFELGRDGSGPTIKAWFSNENILNRNGIGHPLTGGTLFVSNEHAAAIVSAMDAAVKLAEPWFLDSQFGREATAILETLREALS